MDTDRFAHDTWNEWYEREEEEREDERNDPFAPDGEPDEE